MIDLSFYQNKKVLITGHTGFKGSWMCKVLLDAGAIVTGYALEPPTEPNLFSLGHFADAMHSVIGDIRDLDHLQSVFDAAEPEIVIHMAAQPLVRESYQRPVYTYETNVMGTVNVLECVRRTTSVRSFLNVTTDKVYLNREWNWGYRENEELNGYDPYSNSKSCSELVTSSYNNSFFTTTDRQVAISTARAGNVIGGGDFAADRIIPDCIRAMQRKEDIIVRNPYSTRPYQHVLEPVMVYLMLAEAQYKEITIAGNYNVGPDDTDCYTTGELVTLFCKEWSEATGEEASWIDQYDGGPHEANFLRLDCSKVRAALHWQPRWHVEMSMKKIVEWTLVYLSGQDVTACMEKQIKEFLS
ncbi:MAG: CDP-glucose 4,6-dehydratase [Lachnospiraceae bacterium]